MHKKILILFLVPWLFFSCEDQKNGSNQIPDLVIISPGVGRFILKPGESIQLDALVIDNNNQEIVNPELVWSSSNSEVAIITEDGILNAIKEGLAAITVSHENIQSMREVAVTSSKKRVLSELFTSST